MIGINHCDHRDAQLTRLCDGALVIADIDHEQGVRQGAHVLDTTKTALQLFSLALKVKTFFFGHFLKRAVTCHRLQIFKTLDGELDGLVIRQHTAKPAVINKRRGATLRFLANDFTGLTLRADEKNRSFIRRQLSHEFKRFRVQRHGFFKINDMYLVAVTENVRRHFRVPVAGLVPEMDAAFQHFTHD